MKPIVVLITGYAHSGKDTSGDYLVKKCGAKKIALADRLKVVTHRLIKLFYNVDIAIEEFYDQEAKERVRSDIPHTLRTLLQQVGSEIFRDILWKDIWCDIVEKNLSDMTIITDLRFANELDYFRDLEKRGIIARCLSLRINRRRQEIENMAHQSEVDIDSLLVDYDVNNNGSLEDLYIQLDKVL